jgi:hypothetical protein
MSETNTSNEPAEISAEQQAREDGIKISKPKEVPETLENNAIASPGTSKKGGKKTSAIRQNASGAISSGKADVQDQPKKPAVQTKKVEKVALFSTRNVSWPGVGSVIKGYNFVTKEESKRWLTRDHIREATPQEVANNLKG